MTTLLSLLERESRRRNLVMADETLTAATCFTLIRDMPYRRASSRQPEAIIREWQGTCTGKHYALNQIFGELGLRSRVIMCTHRLTRDNNSHFPAELRALAEREPVPDVHTYVKIETDGSLMVVDATWPSSAAPLGMPVNRHFEAGQDMTIACDPVDTYEVPAGQDPLWTHGCEWRDRASVTKPRH